MITQLNKRNVRRFFNKEMSVKVSEDTLQALDKMVKDIAYKATTRANANGRKTVLSKDL